MCLRIYVCMRYARVSPVFATVSATLPVSVIGFGKRRMMERKKKSKKRKAGRKIIIIT